MGEGVPINTLEGWTALQRDLTRTDEGAARDLMELSRDKHRILPQEGGSPGVRLGWTGWGQLCGEVSRDWQLAACPSNTEGQQHILRNKVRKSREVIIPSLSGFPRPL